MFQGHSQGRNDWGHPAPGGCEVARANIRGPWLSALEVLGQELVQAVWWGGGGLVQDNVQGVKRGAVG